jgi:hypothetical protein
MRDAHPRQHVELGGVEVLGVGLLLLLLVAALLP